MLFIKKAQDEGVDSTGLIAAQVGSKVALDIWKDIVETMPSAVYVSALPATVSPSKQELLALTAALFYQKQVADLLLVQRDLLLNHILSQIEKKPVKSVRKRIII